MGRADFLMINAKISLGLKKSNINRPINMNKNRRLNMNKNRRINMYKISRINMYKKRYKNEWEDKITEYVCKSSFNDKI